MKTIVLILVVFQFQNILTNYILKEKRQSNFFGLINHLYITIIIVIIIGIADESFFDVSYVSVKYKL